MKCNISSNSSAASAAVVPRDDLRMVDANIYNGVYHQKKGPSTWNMDCISNTTNIIMSTKFIRGHVRLSHSMFGTKKKAPNAKTRLHSLEILVTFGQPQDRLSGIQESVTLQVAVWMPTTCAIQLATRVREKD